MKTTDYQVLDSLMKTILDKKEESEWSPSTISAHTEEVFDHFDNISIAKTPGLNGTSDYICKIYSSMFNQHIRVIASTKALAICLAALDAYGINRSHIKG